MGDFIFAVNAILPIIILIAIGFFLRKINLVSDEALRCLNKLVFNLFLQK